MNKAPNMLGQYIACIYIYMYISKNSYDSSANFYMIPLDILFWIRDVTMHTMARHKTLDWNEIMKKIGICAML